MRSGFFIGATLGKTFVLVSGHVRNVNTGICPAALAPDGGNNFKFKFGISWILP